MAEKVQYLLQSCNCDCQFTFCNGNKTKNGLVEQQNRHRINRRRWMNGKTERGKKECLDSYTNKFKCSSSTTMEYRRNECSAKPFKWDRTRFVGFFFNSKFSILLSHVLFIPIYFVCAFLFLSLFFLHFHSCNGHFVWLEKLLNTKQITTTHCCIYTQSHTQTHIHMHRFKQNVCVYFIIGSEN